MISNNAAIAAPADADVMPMNFTGTMLQMPAVNKAAGEAYIGIVIKPDGTPAHHVIRLGCELHPPTTWWNAVDWAADHFGSLPTARELTLMFARGVCASEAIIYWSDEAARDDGDYILCLNMMSGKRMRAPAACSAMAVAVRRVPIQDVDAGAQAKEGGVA